MEHILTQPWSWFVLGLVLLISEVVISGAYLFWLGIGVFLTGVCVAIFPEMPIEALFICLAVFMIGSVMVGRTLQERSKAREKVKTNQGLEQYIGQTALSIQTFELQRGRIQLDGTTYSAVSTDRIGANERVRIDRVEDGVFHVSSTASGNVARIDAAQGGEIK